MSNRQIGILLIKIVATMAPIFLFTIIINNRYLLWPATAKYRPNSNNYSIVIGSRYLMHASSLAGNKWIITNPVTPIAIRMPRSAPKITTSILLTSNKPTFISMVALDVDPQNEITSIIRDPQLDNLQWSTTRTDMVTLWQRPGAKQYATLAAWQADPDNREKTGVINVEPLMFASPSVYHPSTEPLVLPQIIRGQQSINFYAANEDINIEFDKQDIFHQKQSEDVFIRLQRLDPNYASGGRVVYEQNYNGSTVTNYKTVTPPIKHFTIHLAQATPAMYRLDIVTSDNIRILNFTSWQHILGFRRMIHLSQSPLYQVDEQYAPVRVITDSKNMTLTADHESGAQKININKKIYNLQKAKVAIPVKNLARKTQFNITKGDVIINGDGLFTLAPFTLPESSVVPLIAYPAPVLKDYNYILAAYSPQTDYNNIAIKHEYQIDQRFNNRETLHFRIYTPDVNDQAVTLVWRKMAATYYPGSFPWTKLKNKITSIISDH